MICYIERAQDRAHELGLVPPGACFPCSAAEVATLEDSVGVPLPAAYKEYLRWIGRGCRSMLVGIDCRYQDLAPLREWAIELLEEDNSPTTLPTDAFVFLMHQGYQFMFFRLSEGDDPPVYYYHEAMPERSFMLWAPSFSDILLRFVEEAAQLNAQR